MNNSIKEIIVVLITFIIIMIPVFMEGYWNYKDRKKKTKNDIEQIRKKYKI